MSGRKILTVVVALGIALLAFFIARGAFQSRTEPMESAPTPSEQQEIKNLLPPSEKPAEPQKKN